MELSLLHSSSAARALFRNSPSSPQITTATTTVRHAGQFTCSMSSRCSRILPPSTAKLYGQRRSSCSAKLFFYQQNKSYSKVAPHQSYGRKSTAVPFIRAATQFEDDKSDTSPLKKILQFGNVLLQFVRPYVAVGTVIGFSGVAARTWVENPHLLKLSWSLILKTIAAIVAVLSQDGFVCGINQIFDLDIDKCTSNHH